ncbi:hypothetical protein BDR05DRAFT_961671 [Suillus weaverae]|nr:hypothetical protein BDR05DRAFT_961671 [Suillus weaverae]
MSRSAGASREQQSLTCAMISSCTVFALLDDHTDATHQWVHITDFLFAWAIGEL